MALSGAHDTPLEIKMKMKDKNDGGQVREGKGTDDNISLSEWFSNSQRKTAPSPQGTSLHADAFPSVEKRVIREIR